MPIATSSSVSDWTLSMATGGAPLNLRHSTTGTSIFSQDGRYNIVILTHQIRVYFISTRQCIRTIDLDLVDLVDAKIDVTNPSHLLLFKSTGELITVNWKDKVSEAIISTVKIETLLPILSIVSAKHLSIVYISGKKDKRRTASGGSFGSSHTRYINYFDRNSDTTTTLLEIPNCIEYAISGDSKKVAFINSQHEVVLVDLTTVYNKNDELEQELISQETIPFPFKSQITAVAVSNDDVIAIGTASGTIQVLSGGLTTSKPQRLLKWHIDQVKSLQFSSDNNYLISGGGEKVLVFWQLETEKKQFLPRLNGSIEKISVDNSYISLLLSSDDTYEVLILSAVDLISRLSVNTIRPKFSNQLKPTLSKTKRKYLKSSLDFDQYKLKHDYSCKFEIHPKSKHLYLPNHASIQAYDLVKNEQAFIQHAAPVLTTGKVRSETKLIDPNVTSISFTHDGEWMCTFDEVVNSEIDNLLSKKDKQYALKFWRFVEPKNDSANTKNGSWELSTKVIDPHGNSNPILSIIPAPTSYFNGLAFLTADSKGGLRIWRPSVPKEAYQIKTNTTARQQQTAWTMRKSKAPLGAQSSDAVDLCWSDDSSIIFLAVECSIKTINSRTMEEIPYQDFPLPAVSGSRIRSISLVDNHLVILSKTRISSFNLLTAQLTDLVAKVNTTLGGKNLIAVDPIANIICLAVNYYHIEQENNNEFKLHSKLLLFKPNQLKPIHVQSHNQGIASVRNYKNNSFVFVDLDSRVGTLNSSSIDLSSKIESDLTHEISTMLINSRAGATNVTHNGEEEVEQGVTRVIDLHTIQPIFQNIEGVQIETLFDRIVKVLK
ncbi:NET1-associated nuclear protein 1 [Spathaspora sp. JA1]|nr:NET1-associated nuclear protein 1 [Spathaspora sp. JA1]